MFWSQAMSISGHFQQEVGSLRICLPCCQRRSFLVDRDWMSLQVKFRAEIQDLNRYFTGSYLSGKLFDEKYSKWYKRWLVGNQMTLRYDGIDGAIWTWSLAIDLRDMTKSPPNDEPPVVLYHYTNIVGFRSYEGWVDRSMFCTSACPHNHRWCSKLGPDSDTVDMCSRAPANQQFHRCPYVARTVQQ